MKIEFMEIRAELIRYVQAIWLLENPGGLAPSDVSLAAPNGAPKLIFNFENSVTSVVNGHIQKSKEHTMYFVGTRDTSALLYTEPGKVCCIGVEFYPHGAYPIFGIPMGDLSNRLLPIDDLSTRWHREFHEIIPELRSPQEAVIFIQARLIEMLMKNRIENPIVEYCVACLKSTNGLITISDLERKTGYGRRYLEILFSDHVGFSPKVLAGIFRFQKFYKKWASGNSYDEIRDELYNYYYDQAHFTKEFKRMTGFTPQHYSTQVANEFGRRLALY